jgi:hypothetical protein
MVIVVALTPVVTLARQAQSHAVAGELLAA